MDKKGIFRGIKETKGVVREIFILKSTNYGQAHRSQTVTSIGPKQRPCGHGLNLYCTIYIYDKINLFSLVW
jgi:hypothetical protein